MKTLYILDAAGYIYRSYFAIRGMTNSKGESTNALFGFIRSLLKLMKDFHPEHLVAVFDGPQNIQKREALYKDYKAHRSSMPPDLLYQIHYAKDFCTYMGIPWLCVAGVEADDTMGSIAAWAKQFDAKIFLCTSDKDLAQLVDEKTFMLNTHKDNLILGPKEVEEVFGVPPSLIVDYLAITGDASDNVPGIAGFGPKTAAELLQKYGSLEYILEHPDEIGGKKRDVIIQQKDNALLSKALVTLHTDVEFPKDKDFFQIKPFDKKALKDFYIEMNFNTLVRETESLKDSSEKEECEYLLIETEESLIELVNFLKNQKEIVFKTETADQHIASTKLIGISFSIAHKKAWYIPLNGPIPFERVINAIKELMENPQIKFAGHNVKFDLHALHNSGISDLNASFDTTLASYVLSSHSRQHSLDQLSLDFFGKIKTPLADLVGKGKNAISLSDVEIAKIKDFSCEAVDYILRLKERLEIELEERNLMPLYCKLELPLLKVLAKMEQHGIFVDLNALKEFSSQLSESIQELTHEIYALAGEQFNINSPKQLSAILFEKLNIKAPKKTATGHSTSSEVLDLLKWDYPIAGKIQEYRILEKLRSTYADALPLEVSPKTKRIHPTFNQTVAATGRLSCQDPNLQNIPVRTEMGRKIREAFRPELENWSFLSADYSQIELRLLAHLSEDPVLIEAFQKNEDIHTHTAASIFNLPLDKVSKELRYRAKAVNFGIIYGQSPFGLSQELGIDVKEAAHFIELYFQKYPRVKDFLESCKDRARLSGKAVTMTGRERAIPEINSKNIQIRNAAERLAVNTPFQGTAADIIKLAMLKIDEEITKRSLKGYMILQIHDELIFEIPDEEIPVFKALVKESMENVIDIKVPLLVEISIGRNWKEC